jgi:hypothetical protein
MFFSSAASVLASTVCIVPLILGSTVAHAQEGSMLGVLAKFWCWRKQED